MGIDDQDLGRFGIVAADEGVHPFPPDSPTWNESVFFDWYVSSREAGHVRIGRMPGSARTWLWVYLLVDGEWLVLDEPRLAATPNACGFDLALPGLTVVREVEEPLRRNRLVVSGTGRCASGERAGALVPFSLDLRFEALGPAHSLGEQVMAGHAHEGFSSNRFEQPMRVHGTRTADGDTRALEGHGERDHSWGPRNWTMQWQFMVAQRDDLRLQACRVEVEEDAFFDLGYLSGETTESLIEADFSLEFRDAPRAPFDGRVMLTSESGVRLGARIEALDACAIDASHVCERPSGYARALVRLHPDDGSPVLHGWLEVHRFVAGTIA